MSTPKTAPEKARAAAPSGGDRSGKEHVSKTPGGPERAKASVPFTLYLGSNLMLDSDVGLQVRNGLLWEASPEGVRGLLPDPEVIGDICGQLWRAWIANQPRPVAAAPVAQEDPDPFARFLDEACIVTGYFGDRIHTRDLCHAFMFWQMLSHGRPFRERPIHVNLKDRSRTWISKKTGHRFAAHETGTFNGYDGIKLAPEFASRLNAAAKDAEGRPIGIAVSGSGPA